jgi:hypothetical protein
VNSSPWFYSRALVVGAQLHIRSGISVKSCSGVQTNYQQPHGRSLNRLLTELKDSGINKSISS